MKSPLKPFQSLAALIVATHDIVQSSGNPDAHEQLRDLKEMSDELTKDINPADHAQIEHAALNIHGFLTQLDPRVAMTSLATVTATTGIMLATMLAPNGSHPWPASQPTPKEPVPDLETLVRAKGMTMVKDGNQEALRTILGEFGAENISGVAPDRLNELNAKFDEFFAGHRKDVPTEGKVVNIAQETPPDEEELVLAIAVRNTLDILPRNEATLGIQQGFIDVRSPWGALMNMLPYLVFLRRSTAEKDTQFKQLIPYAVVLMDGKVLVYTRGKSGAEDRLHNKRSIGIGGHINPIDVDGGNVDIQKITGALERELKEELGVLPHRDVNLSDLIGFINDDENPVGQVHLGMLFVIELKPGTVIDLEHCLNDAEWLVPGEIEVPSLETWSAMALMPVIDHVRVHPDATALDTARTGTPAPSGLSREQEDEMVWAGYQDAKAHYTEGTDCVNPFAPESVNYPFWQRGADNFKASLTKAGSDGPEVKEDGDKEEAAAAPKTRDELANDDQKRGFDETKDAFESQGPPAHCPFTKEDRVKDWNIGSSVFINTATVERKG